MADVTITTKLTGVSTIQTGMKSIEGSIGRIERKARSATKRLQVLGTTLVSVGKSATLALTVPIIAASVVLTKFAADAVESENLFEVSMGKMADEARAFSETLRSELGLNAFAIRNQIGVFNQMLSSMGLGTEASFSMAKGMTQLTQDMASFFNIRPEEAFQKLQAGITGEVEPLKRLGIIVNETTIKTAALAAGIIKSGEAMTEAQKVAARYIVIVQQTKNAQGDLARTIDSPTNRFRILKTQMEEVAIEMGMVLIPVISALAGMVKSFIPTIRSWIKAFDDLSPATKGFAIAVAGILVVIGPLSFVLGKIVLAAKGMLAVFIALNAPIVAIALGIAAIVAVGIAVVRSWEKVKAAATRIWSAIKITVLENVRDIVDGVNGGFAELIGIEESLEGVRDTVQSLIDREVADNVSSGAKSVADSVKDAFTAMVNDLSGLRDKLTDALASPFKEMGNAANKGAEDTQKKMLESMNKIIEAAKKMNEGVVRETEKQIAARLKAEQRAIDESQKLINDWLDFRISTGEAALEDRIAQINEELAAVEQGTRKELELRKRLAETKKEILEREKEDLEGFGKVWNAKLEELGANALALAAAMEGALASAFKKMLTGAKSFSDIMKDLFADMVDAVLTELAKIAAAESLKFIISLLTGVPISGGGGGFFSSIGDIFGGFFAHGGDFVAQRPQLIAVGERGAERVTVSPLAGGSAGGRGGGNTFIIQGLFDDEFQSAMVARRIARDIEREQSRRV